MGEIGHLKRWDEESGVGGFLKRAARKCRESDTGEELFGYKQAGMDQKYRHRGWPKCMQFTELSRAGPDTMSGSDDGRTARPPHRRPGMGQMAGTDPGVPPSRR